MIDYIKDKNTRKRIAEFLISSGMIKEEKDVTRNIPQKLYKYTNLSEYAMSNLEKSELTITNPKLFNDVYDSNMHRKSFPRVEKEIHILNEQLNSFGYDKIEMDMENLKKDFYKRDRYFMTYMTEPIRIGCFSEEEKSILMWSHYANNNQGICLEYDLSNCNVTDLLYPVIYLEEPIDTTELCEERKYSNLELAVLLSIITKYNIWNYEREWRIILGVYGGKELPDRTQIINIPNPSTIYLGKNFLKYWINEKKSDRALFNRFCEYVKNNNIKLKIMRNKLLSFELEAIDIELDEIRFLDEIRLIKYLI